MSETVTKADGRLLVVRVVVGLMQGLSLYALVRWGAQLLPVPMAGLTLTVRLVPIVALGAIGAARPAVLAGWLGAATLITFGLGGYSGFTEPQGTGVSPAVAFFTAVTLYILHHLILPAQAERRWRATFERYFDEAWKDAVRLALSALFVGAIWLLIWLGASLFHLIGLEFLKELIRRPWFYFPATTTFFALAVHLTDVRVGLVRGARTLVLSLLSWLLPLLTVIAVGFLLALPFTGLQPLWRTHSATGVMLTACAALIILINAAYQDGDPDRRPVLPLRWSVRIASLCLPPLAMVAAYGVYLRVAQHGLTPARIYATASLLIAACYAAGYTWAALSRGPWMRRLETTNWATAQVVVIVLITIFSPVLDPARLSVRSQVNRLEEGRVQPLTFDYAFLRFGSGRWGEAALQRLAASPPVGAGREIADLARAQLERKNRQEKARTTSALRKAEIHSVGAPLPADFVSQRWSPEEEPACPDLGESGPGAMRCEAVVADIDGAPGPEVIVFGAYLARVYSRRDGQWIQIGELKGARCRGDLDAIRKGEFKITPEPPRKDVEVGGHAMVLVLSSSCPPPPTPHTGNPGRKRVNLGTAYLPVR